MTGWVLPEVRVAIPFPLLLGQDWGVGDQAFAEAA